ncbi:TDP-N-acetylfucosamine:lipid II N-acetylfucosaminyltransferase [Arenimonas fontis]|nr:TDP-N-acetylfucosamine:lipid II N-acetylfucosaminyltransferase [Arenimonas fontis]
MSSAAHPADGGRFLHVVPDDKFIDLAIESFEQVAPGAHAYVHLACPTSFRYLRSGQVMRLGLRQALSADFLAGLERYTAVFIHYLDDRARLLVNACTRKVNLVWIGWGGDYYHLAGERCQLLLPETRKLVEATSPTVSEEERRELARSVPEEPPERDESGAELRVRVRRLAIGPGGRDEIGLLNRFRLFGPVLRQDYELVRTANPGFLPAYVRWNYPLGPAVEEDDQLASGQSILVGNSAAPTNNHLETFRELANSWGGSRRIICPLSYGADAYADAVEEEGRRLFGDRFIALRSFLPFHEYMAIIRQCSAVVMGHFRQQGFGNILHMLKLGATVYLREQNPICDFLRGHGLPVRRFGDGRPLAEAVPASPEQVADWRRKIDGLFGPTAHLESTRCLLATAAQSPPLSGADAGTDDELTSGMAEGEL